MMSDESRPDLSRPRICFAGEFPFIPQFDADLGEELFRIDTSSQSSDINIRVVPIGTENDSPDHGRPRIAVSTFRGQLLIYDALGGILSAKSAPSGGGGGITKNPGWGLHCLRCRGTAMSDPSVLLWGRNNEVLIVDPSNGSIDGNLPEYPLRSTHSMTELPGGGTGGSCSRNGIVAFGGAGFPYIVQYDVNRETRMCSYVGHRGLVSGLAKSESAAVLISVSRDFFARVWSCDTLECQRKIQLRTRGYGCYFADDLNMLIVGLQMGGIEFWDLRKLDERLGHLPTGLGHDWDIDRIDETGTRFVSACNDGWGAIWDPYRKKVIGKYMVARRTVAGCCVLNSCSSSRFSSSVDVVSQKIAFINDGVKSPRVCVRFAACSVSFWKLWVEK